LKMPRLKNLGASRMSPSQVETACVFCLLHFSSARCARTHSYGTLDSGMFLGILCLSCLPLFSSARCARTHSESVFVCMQARVLCTPAVGFLFAIFSSARCARTYWALSGYSRLGACSLGCCAFPACHFFHRLAALAHTLRVF
jgi:hypothetical protein